jgi:excisionase family DNA binding protein
MMRQEFKVPKPSQATLTVKNLADRYGIGLVSAYEAVHRGDVPSIRIGKRILIPKAALERLEAGGETQSNDNQ